MVIAHVMISGKPRDKNQSDHRFIGTVMVTLVVCFFFSIGIIPFVLYLSIVYLFFNVSILWHWFFVPILLYLGFVIAFVSEIVLTGLLMRLFHLRYKPGVFPYGYTNKNAFIWILVCSLYTPSRKLMEIFLVGGIKNFYFRLLGMKIGENTLLGGVVKDPCVTSFGENTTMGEYAIIYGHITNYQRGTISIKPVSIGNNCVIGAGAIIMPGAVIEDDVIVAAGAVVSSNQRLKKAKTYVGIPAKAIE